MLLVNRISCASIPLALLEHLDEHMEWFIHMFVIGIPQKALLVNRISCSFGPLYIVGTFNEHIDYVCNWDTPEGTLVNRISCNFLSHFVGTFEVVHLHDLFLLGYTKQLCLSI